MSSTDTIDDTSSSSQESLDLDYDDWEGQFEFVGPSVLQAPDQTRRDQNRTTDCDDDLKLNHFVPYLQHQQQSVLFDEETFLSLNLNDFEDCGPPSELFIEDCTTLLKKSNRDSLRNNNGGRKFVSAKFHAEELNNIKNRLLSDEISNMKGMKTNQSNNNINNTNLNNELAADLCDNLTEQVGVLKLNILFITQLSFSINCI